MTVIASALSIRDPRERPVEKAKEADQIHKTFQDPSSDFITLLNIWRKYHETWETEKSNRRMKNFCNSNYLSYKRMREWRDINAQITEILKEYGCDDQTIETLKNPNGVVNYFSKVYVENY